MNILIAFPFSIYPVKSGGALRGYNILLELVRHHSVTAIIVDSSVDVYASITRDIGYEPQSLEIKRVNALKKDRGLWEKIVDRVTTILLSGSLNTRSNSITLSISRIIRELANPDCLDIAILSTQELAICGTLLKKITPLTLRIIDLHNVDHVLMGQELRAKEIDAAGNESYREVKRVESKLFQYSDGVFTCSEFDRKTIQDINLGRLAFSAVVPNGVRCSANKFDDRSTKSASNEILFCGSLSYEPNIDALNWFHSMIWPSVRLRMPNSRLLVVGRGMVDEDFLELANDDAVELIGEVEDLGPWYARAGISICPLRMGSGTRLKILEAMAFGNPVVSTSIGCEGLLISDGKHLLIRDNAEGFADGIIELATNRIDFDRVRLAARAQVENLYDWETIGNDISSRLLSWTNSRE